MRPIQIPIDTESLCECKFDVSSFQHQKGADASTPFALTENQVVEVDVEVNDVRLNSTDHPATVRFIGDELTVVFSDWDLTPGTRYPVTIRFTFQGKDQPVLIVGAFTYTRIVLIPQ